MRRTLLLLAVVMLTLGIVNPVWAETTITVPTALGWVTTDAMVPLVAEELKADDIKVEMVPTENIVLRDKQMMEGRMGTGAFDVMLAWEALMPLMTDFLEPLDQYIIDAGMDLEAFKSSFYPAVDEITARTPLLDPSRFDLSSLYIGRSENVCIPCIAHFSPSCQDMGMRNSSRRTIYALRFNKA